MSARLSEETAHRDTHDGVWRPGCLTCQGFEMAAQTNLLDAIHSTLEAAAGASTIVNTEAPTEIHNTTLHSETEARTKRELAKEETRHLMQEITRLRQQADTLEYESSQKDHIIRSLTEERDSARQEKAESATGLNAKTLRLEEEKAVQARTIRALTRKAEEEKQRADSNWEALGNWSGSYVALYRDVRNLQRKWAVLNPEYQQQVQGTVNEISKVLKAADERVEGLQDLVAVEMRPGWRESGPDAWRKEANILRKERRGAPAAAALCDALADALSLSR